MALETLTRQSADRAGAQLAVQSITSADGFEFPNDGHTILIIENDAGALALGFTITKSVDGVTPAAKAVSVDASEQWVIGPFPKEIYNDADGNVLVTVDADLATATAVISV